MPRVAERRRDADRSPLCVRPACAAKDVRRRNTFPDSEQYFVGWDDVYSPPCGDCPVIATTTVEEHSPLLGVAKGAFLGRKAPLGLTWHGLSGMMTYRKAKGDVPMGNRATQEVIDAVRVVRYNGNNCSGSRAAANTASSERYRTSEERLKRITAWSKSKAQKRSKEAEYRWRYLGGT